MRLRFNYLESQHNLTPPPPKKKKSTFEFMASNFFLLKLSTKLIDIIPRKSINSTQCLNNKKRRADLAGTEPRGDALREAKAR